MYEDNRFNWHRVYCEHVTSAGASTEELNDCEFYNTIAVRDLGVEYLLGSMGLRSPRVDPSGRGILYVSLADAASRGI